jgi:hypothetical protein
MGPTKIQFIAPRMRKPFERPRRAAVALTAKWWNGSGKRSPVPQMNSTARFWPTSRRAIRTTFGEAPDLSDGSSHQFASFCARRLGTINELGSRFLVSVRVPQSGAEARGGLAKPEPGRLNQCCTNEEMMTDVAEGITHSVGVHSRRQVGTYRARMVDRAGRLVRPTVIFEAPDDATAIARARALADDDANIEVWYGTRRVDLINRASGPAASNPPGIRLRMED